MEPDVAYPSELDREWIRSSLPQTRLSFTLPDDPAKWQEISTSLLEACHAAIQDPIGARAMDSIHIALIAGMARLGMQDPPKEPNSVSTRQPLQRSRRQATSVVREAKAQATLDPSKTPTLWAAFKIRRQLEHTAADIATAKETRRNHLLAATNPKRLADAIWGRAMSSDPPNCTSAECTAFFQEIFREGPLPTATPSWLPPQRPPLPLPPLVISPAMVARAIKKKGTKRSAPGLDGITYHLLLQLPWVPKAFAAIFNRIIQQQTAPEIWRYGVTVLLHKGGEKTLPNYRPITLPPTISKLFHSIVASWLERAITSTGTIPTTIQKGFLLGVLRLRLRLRLPVGSS